MILYVTGDATQPDPAHGVIVHCCNDLRIWGAGFTAALDRRWSAPYQSYLLMLEESHFELELGEVSFAVVGPNLHVANVVGQHGVKSRHSEGLPPIRYEALRRGFSKVVDYAHRTSLRHGEPPVIHMPRLGCGLAGGDWALVEPLIEATFVRSGCRVIVYTRPGDTYFDSSVPT